MALKMRKAEAKDITTLCELMSDLGGHAITLGQMQDRLNMVEKSKIDSLFVCEENGTIVGLLGFRIRENLEESSRFGEISAIDVSKEKRRSGVGRFIMDYAETLARQFNCKGMWLVSGFKREKEAHKFYKQLGYDITGYRFVKLFE
jgi:N-acetylglutamate synthase-like GNAT family acetyltransferase